jgi:glycosyltransferase involved in cell wall biosynthesis
MPEPRATVSVVLQTYNHEPFIREAVTSVLTQEADFEYEVIAADDCSTDRTREVLHELAALHPGRLTLFLPEAKLGANRLFMTAIRASRGDYIALIDGDDCWTDPRKLSVQAAFLDAHAECAMCFHQVTAFTNSGACDPFPYHTPEPPSIVELEDLLQSGFLATSAVMVRRSVIGEFPDPFYDLLSADSAFHAMKARAGRSDTCPA